MRRAQWQCNTQRRRAAARGMPMCSAPAIDRRHGLLVDGTTGAIHRCRRMRPGAAARSRDGDIAPGDLAQTTCYDDRAMREQRVEDRGAGQATGSTEGGPGPGKRTLTEALPAAGDADAAQSYSPPGPLPPTGAALDAAEHARLQAVEPTKTTTPDPAKGSGDKLGDKADDKADDKAPLDMTGIGATVAVDRFIVAAKDVQKNWGTLKTEERADRLGKAANAELKAVGCYEVTPKLEDLSEAGKFHFSTWVLGLGKAPFGAASVDDGQAAEIADTVYHESRHAEQCTAWRGCSQAREPARPTS
jgi:hypothetical protein